MNSINILIQCKYIYFVINFKKKHIYLYYLIPFIVLILIKLNECNEIGLLKKEINNLKEQVKYLGHSMSAQITEFKEETDKGISFHLLLIKVYKSFTFTIYLI
jgi:hypothetical protein